MISASSCFPVAIPGCSRCCFYCRCLRLRRGCTRPTRSSTFSYLRSIWFDRDVSFENEYRYFYDHNIAQSGGYYETFLVRETAAGRRVNYGTIGCALLWSPFYAVADLWTRVTGGVADGLLDAIHPRCGLRIGVLRFSRRSSIDSELPESFWHQLEAGSWRLEAAPFVAGLAVWLGTPLLFYMYVAPPFSHAVSAFCRRAVCHRLAARPSRMVASRVFVLGACAALLAMVREQDHFHCARACFRLRPRSVNSQLPTPNCQKDTRMVTSHWRWGNRVHPWLSAAVDCLQRAQRLSRAGGARGAQDVLVCAACAPGALFTEPWIPVLDAACGAGDRGFGGDGDRAAEAGLYRVGGRLAGPTRSASRSAR